MSPPAADLSEHLPLSPHVFEILLTLEDGPCHGYSLIGAIRERNGGAWTLGTSTLYAAIRRMLRAGLVADAGEQPRDTSGGPPRRYYRITPLGRRVARAEAERLQHVAGLARRKFLSARPSRGTR